MNTSRFQILLITMVTLIVVFTSMSASAQDGGQAGGDEISLFLGSMLPNQIDGVTEILPVFGGRYSFGTTFGAIEAGAMNTHARGVDFTTAEVSLRGDVRASDGINGIIYVGVDANWYRPEGSTERKLESGLHLGTGMMMLVSNTVWLRTDLKFMGGPGTSLYLLLGLVFKGSGGGQ